MFCCSKKKEQNKTHPNQIQPLIDQTRSHSQINLDSPNKKQMFSKQSPHYGPIDISKKSFLYADDFDEKTKLHCRFCGGKSCKHENWLRCQNPAIKGLHSNWINDFVIASQRLSDRLIKEYDIIQQFKEQVFLGMLMIIFRKGVTAVFNLQEPGEHPFCGDGISSRTGFSYTPELLMNQGIQFFNFFWKDLTNPSFERLLNSVQVMDFVIRNGGKVLVHCHAGQGRTALVIGAYLIISGMAQDDKDAIAQTRKNRDKCFKKGYNQRFLKTWFDQLCQLRIIFPSSYQRISLKKLLEKQNLLLHGEERRFIKFIPKVLHLVLLQIKKCMLRNPEINIEEIRQQFVSPKGQLLNEVELIKSQINQSRWEGITSCENITTLALVFVKFLEGLELFTLEKVHLEAIQQDYKKLDNYILGFLTSIADIIQSLTNNQEDQSTIDDIYDETSILILQEQSIFKDHIVKILKTLGKQKEQIYQKEESKEEISPIKQQVKISTNPDLFKVEQQKKLLLEGLPPVITLRRIEERESNNSLDQKQNTNDQEKD